MGRCSIWTENGLAWLLFHNWLMHTVVTMWSKWQASWGIQELGYHSNQSIMDNLFGWKITGFWMNNRRPSGQKDCCLSSVYSLWKSGMCWSIGCKWLSWLCLKSSSSKCEISGWPAPGWNGTPLYRNGNRIQASNLQLYSQITRCW